MDKATVNQWLLYVFIGGYVLLALAYVINGIRSTDVKEQSSYFGCAGVMVIVPIILGLIWWYINLPDKLLR